MQLFVYIAAGTDTMPPILTELMDAGVSGATMLDCKGMLAEIDESGMEPPPIFGSLRQFLNPGHRAGKMLLVLLKDEDVPKVRDIIHHVCGSLKAPNTGVLFTVPVMNWEGVAHK